MKHDLKHGKIVFITTPRFRTFSPEVVKDFVYSHLYKICTPIKVITTGRTVRLLTDIVNISPDDSCSEKRRALQRCAEKPLDSSGVLMHI